MFNFGVIATVLVISVLLIISGIKILREYERAVIFRLGRLVQARGPGITYVIPFVEKMTRVELRTVTMDVPPQDVITRDNVSIKVSAVLYFRVISPNRAVGNQSGFGRTEGHRSSSGDAAGHGQAGGGGARETRKDHSRGGRISSLAEARGCS